MTEAGFGVGFLVGNLGRGSFGAVAGQRISVSYVSRKVLDRDRAMGRGEIDGRIEDLHQRVVNFCLSFESLFRMRSDSTSTTKSTIASTIVLRRGNRI